MIAGVFLWPLHRVGKKSWGDVRKKERESIMILPASSFLSKKCIVISASFPCPQIHQKNRRLSIGDTLFSSTHVQWVWAHSERRVSQTPDCQDSISPCFRQPVFWLPTPILHQTTTLKRIVSCPLLHSMAVKHVPWSEEITINCPNWCHIFSSSSFIALCAFAFTLDKQIPVQGQYLFLSEPICSSPGLPASVWLASYVQGLPTGKSATQPSAVSVSFAGRWNSAYWHFVPKRVQEEYL